LVAFSLLTILGLISSERIISSEILSEDRLKGRVEKFNEWYSKINPSSKVEAKLGSDKKLHLVAKSNLKAEDTYMTLDKNLTINPDLIYKTKMGSLVRDLEETYGYDDFLNMVLYLLHEMGNPESEWKAYLDILPRKIDNLAFNYWERKGPIEEELLHTPFLKKLVDYKINVERRAQSILTLVKNSTDIFDSEIFNYENLEWAMMTLESRQISIGFETFLIPMLDLVNFKESPKNPSRTLRLKYDESETTPVKSQSDVAKGNEVFENLPLNSDNLLLYKGIINDNNFHDCFSFTGNFEDRSQDGLTRMRNYVFSKYFLFDENERIDECISTKDPFSRRFLFFFYVSMLDEFEMDREDIKRIGLEEDRVLLQYVKNALQSQFDLYPSKLKDDLERIQNPEIEPDRKTAILYMIQQKRILLKLIEIYENEINRLIKEDTL
jgi:hypothetical protein